MAYVIGEDCIACGSCISECPVEAISEGDIYKIDPDLCTECGTCADICPNEAISLPYLDGIKKYRVSACRNPFFVPDKMPNLSCSRDMKNPAVECCGIFY